MGANQRNAYAGVSIQAGYFTCGTYVGNGVAGRQVSLPFFADFIEIWSSSGYGVSQNYVWGKKIRGSPSGIRIETSAGVAQCIAPQYICEDEITTDIGLNYFKPATAFNVNAIVYSYVANQKGLFP